MIKLTFSWQRSGALLLLVAIISLAVRSVIFAAAPVPQNDVFSTPFETRLVVSADDGVLANDSDSDGDNLNARIVSTPQHSQTFSLAADGSFSYTPAENYVGTDSFTYAVDDGTNAEGATLPQAIVTIQVNPVAVADLYETEFEKALTIAAPGVLINDQPVENMNKEAVLVSNPAFGTIALGTNGAFSYTPQADFSGIDTFSYRVRVGSNISPATLVTLSIKQNPEATANNDTYSTSFGQTLTVSVENGVLKNDEDTNNDPLTAKLGDIPDHGALTLNANGSFTYVPETNFFGTDTFTYAANDGVSDSNLATVTINVLAPPPRNLSILGELNQGVIRPRFLWNRPLNANEQPVDLEWYNLVIERTNGTVVLDMWQEASTICNSSGCLLRLSPELSNDAVAIAGLTNGTYNWNVRGWDLQQEAFSSYAVPSGFTVNVPLPDTPEGFTVTSELGRPAIGFPNDPNTTWVHVYVGEINGMTVHLEWYNKEDTGFDSPFKCSDTQCLFIPETNPPNGDYEVWLQVWGPGGYNANSPSIWAGARTFSMNFGQTPAVTPLTGTATATEGTFTWQSKPGTSWYNIWIGTPGPSYEPLLFEWFSAYDLGCHEGGICTLHLEAPAAIQLVSSTAYTWYLKGWGPGGYSAGGIEGTGWVEGNDFTVQ